MFVSLYSMTGLKLEISRPGEPGVYVRLSVYYDWITQVMNGRTAVDRQLKPLQVYFIFLLLHNVQIKNLIP